MVLTWVPSSMVWMVKSISGRGFFCWIARMALSTCTSLARRSSGEAMMLSSVSMAAVASGCGD
jgi:hypothetical protein